MKNIIDKAIQVYILENLAKYGKLVTSKTNPIHDEISISRDHFFDVVNAMGNMGLITAKIGHGGIVLHLTNDARKKINEGGA